MYKKIFLVFIIDTMLTFRGHPLNSLKGNVWQNLKMAYCPEAHFKQFMLYNVSQNVFRLRDRKHQSFKLLALRNPLLRNKFSFSWYQLIQNVKTSNFASIMLNKFFLVYEILRKYFWPLSALNLKGWPLKLDIVEYALSLSTTFVLYVFSNYFRIKRYWEKCDQKCNQKKWRFFGSWRASTFFASTKFDFQSAYLQILLYNRWKFEVDIFSSFWEHSRTSGPLKIHKNVNIWRNIWRNEKQKNHYQVHVNIYHPWKFQKDWTTHIREIACTKSVRKKIIITRRLLSRQQKGLPSWMNWDMSRKNVRSSSSIAEVKSLHF